MKRGRFEYIRGHALQCRDCGFAYPLRVDNPEAAMIAEENLEATHICPIGKTRFESIRVISGTSPKAMNDARFVLGF